MKNYKDKNTIRKLSLSVILIGSFAIYVIFSANKPVFIPSTPASNSLVIDSKVNTTKGTFKDGVYTGPVIDVYYGNVEVEATITNGRLIDVKFLQHPSDADNSVKIYNRASPILKSEAIANQSGNVDIVSGATQTSKGFIKSLSGALAKAQ